MIVYEKYYELCDVLKEYQSVYCLNKKTQHYLLTYYLLYQVT